MKRHITKAEEGLRAYLTGYGRKNRAELEAIADYNQWPAAAARELVSRMVQVLEALPYEELEAIATRKINLNELARQALADLEQE